MFKKTLLTAASLAAPTVAMADGPGDGYYHHMDGWGYGVMGFGVMGLFWIAIIVLIVFAIKWFAQDQQPTSRRGSSAIDLLRERLAKGEIDVDEFESRKAALEK